MGREGDRTSELLSQSRPYRTIHLNRSALQSDAHRFPLEVNGRTANGEDGRQPGPGAISKRIFYRAQCTTARNGIENDIAFFVPFDDDDGGAMATNNSYSKSTSMPFMDQFPINKIYLVPVLSAFSLCVYYSVPRLKLNLAQIRRKRERKREIETELKLSLDFSASRSSECVCVYRRRPLSKCEKNCAHMKPNGTKEKAKCIFSRIHFTPLCVGIEQQTSKYTHKLIRSSHSQLTCGKFSQTLKRSKATPLLPGLSELLFGTVVFMWIE